MKTCEEIARLVSEGLDRDLSFIQKLQVRLHLGMCKLCRKYEKQLIAIGFAAKCADEKMPITQTMCEEAKDRIRGELSRAQ